MRVLTTAAQINDELNRLVRECAACKLAVAWASVGFGAFDLLAKNSHKIQRMIVGTHFYQTHPDLIETFQDHAGVRFVLNPDGVFHPKVYLFLKRGGAWECLLGSPNFTHSAVALNDEIAVHLTNRDTGAQDVFAGIEEAIAEYWRKASPLGNNELQAYRDAWRRKQAALNSVRGRFGSPDSEKGDQGRPTLDVPILRMDWTAFYRRVRSEKNFNAPEENIKVRLRTLRAMKALFSAHEHFRDLDKSGRRKIAGLVKDGHEGIIYDAFGSMRGNGKFQHAINENNRNLSLALDAIPANGPVEREDYLQYVERFKKAFPNGGSGVAIATRLLAMKRPDTFVCLDSRNRERLCKAFRISRTVGYEKYWDSIVERVKDSVWWSAPAPARGEEREVWESRAAFLDAHFYDKDMSR